ncbi:MAG: dihydrofolate reductase family protein [Acidimicrobiia bacterium]|nr:dihydrofolate reductase family protein [Acidimicrobiia bacterium]
MERPKVITCNMVSVDGRLTIAPDVQLLFGDQRWSAIAGSADPYTWVREIHDPDLLLEGSNSFVGPDAEPIAYPTFTGDVALLQKHFLPAEIIETPGRHWFTVVDGRGRVQLQFTEWPDPAWSGWHALVLTSHAASPGHLEWLRRVGIPYLVAGEGRVDLVEALQLLWSELGVRTVVSTGGGLLGGALLRKGLVDEIDLEVLPAAIGGRGTPALFDAEPLGPSEHPQRLRLLTCDLGDDDHLRLRYAVEH